MRLNSSKDMLTRPLMIEKHPKTIRKSMRNNKKTPMPSR